MRAGGKAKDAPQLWREPGSTKAAARRRPERRAGKEIGAPPSAAGAQPREDGEGERHDREANATLRHGQPNFGPKRSRPRAARQEAARGRHPRARGRQTLKFNSCLTSAVRDSMTRRARSRAWALTPPFAEFSVWASSTAPCCWPVSTSRNLRENSASGAD